MIRFHGVTFRLLPRRRRVYVPEGTREAVSWLGFHFIHFKE